MKLIFLCYSSWPSLTQIWFSNSKKGIFLQLSGQLRIGKPQYSEERGKQERRNSLQLSSDATSPMLSWFHLPKMPFLLPPFPANLSILTMLSHERSLPAWVHGSSHHTILFIWWVKYEKDSASGIAGLTHMEPLVLSRITTTADENQPNKWNFCLKAPRSSWGSKDFEGKGPHKKENPLRGTWHFALLFPWNIWSICQFTVLIIKSFRKVHRQ